MLLHGTSAHHLPAILERGLVEPWAGRGVSVTKAWWYARLAAETACLRERVQRGGDDTQGAAVIVAVDLAGLEGVYSTFPLDLAASFVVKGVPPSRIVEVRHLALKLPKPGSWGDRSLQRSGFGSAETGRQAESTLQYAIARAGDLAQFRRVAAQNLRR